jgi:hypothetical protein
MRLWLVKTKLNTPMVQRKADLIRLNLGKITTMGDKRFTNHKDYRFEGLYAHQP